jgi:uncharacterized membrane protein YcaP (DUF421 family)
MDIHDMYTAAVGQSSVDILWWQMSIRAIIIFLYAWGLIRLFGIRAFGKQTALDIVIAIVIGSNFSRALTGNAQIIPTLAATTVLVLLFWLLEHFAARWSILAWLVKGRSIRVMSEGIPDERVMRRNAVTDSDIEEAARSIGIAHMHDIDSAFLERSGKISALKISSPDRN